MKIGIITFWDSQDNYGQLLQCYALQRFLKELGHTPYLIRYKDVSTRQSGFKIKKIPSYILNFKAYFKYFLQRRNTQKYSQVNNLSLRDFDGFRQQFIISHPTIYSKQSIMDNPPEADAYICGSDQIWGGSTVYYLPFVPKGKIKIAYAPSFGGTNPFTTPNSSELYNLLSDFDFIGIREESGANLLHEHGFKNAIQVVDPTLLLNKNLYLGLISKEYSNNNDVFIYLLGNEISCSIDDIFKFIKEKGWSYTYVASQGRIDRYDKVQATIPQWINNISNSKVVITNSFHCVVFALIFHKPFIFLPLSGEFARMNDRLYDLLDKIDLKSQIYNDDFNSIPLNIEFLKFDSYRENQTKKTTDILNSLLSCR